MQTREEASPVSKVIDNKTEQTSTQAQNAQKSLIGKAVRIKGSIAATEHTVIDGKVLGGVVIKNNNLEIGDTAQVDANVFAKVVVVRGKVKGDVTASDQVIVATSGQIEGNINSPALNMEEGAFFKGNINMEQQEISWEETIPDIIHDDNQEKASSFGFLFRRTRAHAEHGTAMAHPEIQPFKVMSEEIKSLTGEPNVPQEPIPVGKTYIGKSVLIKGQIEAEEDMIISGEIVGNIYIKANGLQVAAQAHINGNIYVKELIAHGEVRGDICAEYVSVKKPAHINGVIHSPKVSIETGAAFQGKVEMEPQNVEEAYAKSIASVTTKEKGSFLGKSSEAHEDHKSAVPVTSAKSKRVPWPE